MDLNFVADVVKNAATSNLGIIALVVTLMGIIAFWWFKRDKTLIRVVIFILLFFGGSGIVIALSAATTEKAVAEVVVTAMDRFPPDGLTGPAILEIAVRDYPMCTLSQTWVKQASPLSPSCQVFLTSDGIWQLKAGEGAVCHATCFKFKISTPEN